MSGYWTDDDLRDAVLRMHGPQAPQAIIGPVGSQQHDSAPIEESEASLQTRMVRLAREHGWLIHHVHDSRQTDWRGDAGFPDWVLCRESVLFIELKSRTGKPDAQQHRWLTMLGATTSLVEVYCWHPADWPLIHERLTRPWRQGL